MTPTLIVLALLVMGVGVVVWAAKRKPSQRAPLPAEEDVAWNDPVSSADPDAVEPLEPTPVAPAPPLPDSRS